MTLCHPLRAFLILIMDGLFDVSFFLPELAGVLFPLCNMFINSTFSQSEICVSAQNNNVNFESFVKIITSGLIFCLSFCLFSLPSWLLVSLYFNIFSVSIVLLSYWANIQWFQVLSENIEKFIMHLTYGIMTWDIFGIINNLIQSLFVLFNTVDMLFQQIVLQCILSITFYLVQCVAEDKEMSIFINLSFLIPSLFSIVPGIHGISNAIAVLATLLPLFYLLEVLWSNKCLIVYVIVYRYKRAWETINNFGIRKLVEKEWKRLDVSIALLVFWATRISVEMINLLLDIETKNITIYDVVKIVSLRGCDTCIALLGMTSFLSYFCDIIQLFFQRVILATDRIRNNSLEIFFIQCLQTKLTSQEPEERFTRLCQNLYLTLAAILNCILDDVHGVLLVPFPSSLKMHIRALLVWGFIMVCSITMLSYLWINYSLSSWLLFVSAFYIEIIIHALVSLVLYSLFVIDTYRQTFWEELDNYVFYITSFEKMVKFCLRLYVLMDNLYGMIFVSFNLAYVFTYVRVRDIWNEVRKEWEVLDKRCSVSKLIESLPKATSHQLIQLDDVCAICFLNMESAKITRCNHYYHAACLRKCLEKDGLCPLCKTIM